MLQPLLFYLNHKPPDITVQDEMRQILQQKTGRQVNSVLARAERINQHTTQNYGSTCYLQPSWWIQKTSQHLWFKVVSTYDPIQLMIHTKWQTVASFFKKQVMGNNIYNKCWIVDLVDMMPSTKSRTPFFFLNCNTASRQIHTFCAYMGT